MIGDDNFSLIFEGDHFDATRIELDVGLNLFANGVVNEFEFFIGVKEIPIGVTSLLGW